jgi:hypothetical protein
MQAAAGDMMPAPVEADVVAAVDFDDFVRTQVPALLRTA